MNILEQVNINKIFTFICSISLTPQLFSPTCSTTSLYDESMLSLSTSSTIHQTFFILLLLFLLKQNRKEALLTQLRPLCFIPLFDMAYRTYFRQDISLLIHLSCSWPLESNSLKLIEKMRDR